MTDKNQQDLQSAIDALLATIVEEGRSIVRLLSENASFSNRAIHFIDYSKQLGLLVPNYAIPGWLEFVVSEFVGSFASNNATHRSNFSCFVVERLHEIQQPILVGEEALLNLDSLFEKQRDRQEIPEHFDGLVKRLEELIAEDVIEHRTVQQAIQRLKGVLARNRHGSFTSIMLTINYGRFVIKAFDGVLSTNPITKPVLDSFKDEFEAASQAVDRAKKATEQETIQVLTNLKRLELFMAEHPDTKEAIAGYLPPPEGNAEEPGPSVNP